MNPLAVTWAPNMWTNVGLQNFNNLSRIGGIDSFLYTSGQIALNPENMEMMNGEIEEETEWVLNNIEAILKADGMKRAHIIKTTVYLTDLKDFSRMNLVYEKFFEDTKPARACVQVAALPKGAKVEIDAIAHK